MKSRPEKEEVLGFIPISLIMSPGGFWGPDAQFCPRVLVRAPLRTHKQRVAAGAPILKEGEC